MMRQRRRRDVGTLSELTRACADAGLRVTFSQPLPGQIRKRSGRQLEEVGGSLTATAGQSIAQRLGEEPEDR